MAKARAYIYLEGNEELGDILDLINKSKDEEIVLVVPQDFKVLKNLKNLEIFKKLIPPEKKVYLDSEDKIFLNLASNLGLDIFLKDYNLQETKIVDVKPPKNKQSLEVEKEKMQKINPSPSGSKISSGLRINLGLVKKVILLVISTIFIYISSSFLLGFLRTKAVLNITLEKSSSNFSEVITLKDGLAEVDYKNKILPARKVTLEKAVSDEIETTGILASSKFLPNIKITFYNKLNNDLPLIQGTRLEYDGNVFKTLERITLKAGSPEKPSQNLVEAFPFEIKDSSLYIPKGSRLKIVALEGKEYEKGKLWSDVLYAEVFEDYRADNHQEVKTVSLNDLTNLRLKLEKKIKDVLKGELILLYPNMFYIDDDSLYNLRILNISNQVGEKTNKVSGLIQGKLETMVFSSKELENLVKRTIFEKLGEEREMFMISKFEIISISLIDYDFRQNLMKISVKGKTEILPNISEEIIKNQVKGKTIQEVTNYFSDIKGINRVNIKIWPAWRDKLPQDPNRIQILIK